jgi:hypothetical protein
MNYPFHYSEYNSGRIRADRMEKAKRMNHRFKTALKDLARDTMISDREFKKLKRAMLADLESIERQNKTP